MAEAASQATPTTGEQVFVRRASGLIRTAGTWDVFIYNIGLISIGIAVILNQFFGPAFYPGANMAMSTLIGTLGMLVVGFAYYMWALTFPRSGGNYVYQSRALGPGVAFTMSFMETFVLIFYSALAASLMISVGLSASFGVIGFIADSEAFADAAVWLGRPFGLMLTGSLVLLFAGLLPLFGMRRFFAFQKGAFTVAVVGTIVALVALIFGTRENFVTNFENLTGLEYATVISTAIENGWADVGSSVGTSINFMVWPLLALFGGILSVGIGGEIKKVERAQSVGILGSLATAGVIIIAFAVLSNKVFGYDFQGAIAYNTEVAPEQTTAIAPYFTLLAGILTDNVVWTVLIAAAFAAWSYFWIPAELIYTQRTMVAWSFDRLAPEKLGYVSERFHTPIVAILLSIAVAIFFMWVIAYTSYGTLVLIQGIVLAWGVTMAGGVVFPWRRKELFERSPVASWKIAGIPVFSIVSLLALAFFSWVFYLLWNDELAAGHSTRSVVSLAGMIGGGIVIYALTRWYRRRQGLRVELAFREIPIE